MTAINLAMHNCYGHVIWVYTLRDERKLVYQTGFNGKEILAKVPPECPASVAQAATARPAMIPDRAVDAPVRSQLYLF